MTERSNTSSPEAIEYILKLRSAAHAWDEKIKRVYADQGKDPNDKMEELLGFVQNEQPSPWRQLLDAYDEEADKLTAAGRNRLHDAVWKTQEEASK